MCSPDNNADADELNTWLETASPLNAAEKSTLITNAVLWSQMLTPSVWQEDHILAAHGLVVIDGTRVYPTEAGIRLLRSRYSKELQPHFSSRGLSVDGAFANMVEFAANAR